MMRTLLVLVLLSACSIRDREQTTILDATVTLSATTGYDAELAALDGQIRTHLRRAVDKPADWMVPATLADLYMAHGRLTGSYKDYDRAQVHIDTAFALAPAGSGPFLSRAGLHYTMHRLDSVEADLDRFSQRIRFTDAERARLALMRANLAAQRGDLDAAIAGAHRALRLDDSPGGRTSLAMMLRSRGEWDAAEALLDEAAARYHGKAKEPLAWLTLHKGIFDLDRGRYDEALAHYRDAGEILDGWWLIDEHIAEILTLQGDLDAAEALYGDIVVRTGKPEFMDALAGIAATRGATDQATQWHDRAHEIFEAQMQRYPEAAAGHALGHFLEDGPDEAARTLQLARSNATLRPNREALALLARAQAGAASIEQPVR